MQLIYMHACSLNQTFGLSHLPSSFSLIRAVWLSGAVCVHTCQIDFHLIYSYCPPCLSTRELLQSALASPHPTLCLAFSPDRVCNRILRNAGMMVLIQAMPWPGVHRVSMTQNDLTSGFPRGTSKVTRPRWRYQSWSVVYLRLRGSYVRIRLEEYKGHCSPAQDPRAGR